MLSIVKAPNNKGFLKYHLYIYVPYIYVDMWIFIDIKKSHY